MRRDPQASRFGAGQLSPQRRAADLARLKSEHFDVLVIGGGVTGAGAAVDAASRGLSVALIEARDLASGTSSRSSKLIHGGLRYLEQFEFGLVHEALRERGLLATRLAPHLVRPVPFLVPLTAPAGPVGVPQRVWHRAYYGAGVALYDAFASASALVGRLLQGQPTRGMPTHRHLSRGAARRLFPSLREDAVTGAIEYYDGQVDDARFVATLARTAASLGAAVVTSTRAVGILRSAREVTGVRVRDVESGEEFDVRARTVVSATGVWSDDVSELLSENGRPAEHTGLRVRASKGVHLVVPRSAITGDAGLILRTASSVLFVIPWGGHWIIGTTDTDWNLDRAHPAATANDISYLLEQVNQVLDRPLTPDDIEGVYAGLRPLLSAEAKHRPGPHTRDEQTSALSREHAVVEPMLGLMIVAGGKYTTYRVMAADVIDQVARRLGGLRTHGGRVSGSRTSDLPLLGADGYQQTWTNRADLARRHGLPVGVVEHLLERYGTLTGQLLTLVSEDPTLGRSLEGAPEYLAAEIAYAALAEGALHLDDVLARRTRISIETAHRGVDSAEDTALIMGRVLGWDDASRRREIDHYLARVAAERESQRMPDDATAEAARLGAPDPRGYAAA
ncbi:glycerol-3-phosphate dehydrogenase/oxidase [Planosporangium mesophilum]|uniref:glycerol-3-phosphate dehydrogenase/oxidase n=1 Tax=Planosporangium mesophilum TaxID=689768 RepID=UPI00143CB180|nr:glycerol-3-phosphate dehydrogenase/oxidase [Planosporangium mesophilum]NJC83762.1 glycerol-3-phosphate dehydrogenase/oxidase [Planosporangium mesophilum]